MNFDENIVLKTYSTDAVNQFSKTQEHLSKIKSSFTQKMRGKTAGKLVGSFFATLCWLAVFVVAVISVREIVNEMLLVPTSIALLGLVMFMLLDDIVNFSFCSKIGHYRNSIGHLQGRVSVGKSSIKANHDMFMNSKEKGWDYTLSVGTSIMEEIKSIEAIMDDIETIKTGFINSAKNVFYYASVILITLSGCTALFSVSVEILGGIGSKSIPANPMEVINIVAMLIACVGSVILAKLLWSKTDCAVNNITLFAVLTGPVLFVALFAVVALVVTLVLGVLSIILAILGIVLFGSVVVGCISGG